MKKVCVGFGIHPNTTSHFPCSLKPTLKTNFFLFLLFFFSPSFFHLYVVKCRSPMKPVLPSSVFTADCYCKGCSMKSHRACTALASEQAV